MKCAQVHSSVTEIVKEEISAAQKKSLTIGLESKFELFLCYKVAIHINASVDKIFSALSL